MESWRDSKGAESHEMSRWQGGVDSDIKEIQRRLTVINGDAKAGREAAEKTLVEIAVLRTKVALYSTIGSLLGAGFVSAIVAWLTKGN